MRYNLKTQLMKTLFLLLLMAVSQQITAQETATVNIIIENIANDQGEILLGMSTQEGFMKTKPDFSSTSKIKDGKATITFKDVPYGSYAVSSFHDMNENKKMDFEANGMPKEGYGVSNNPVLMGPPTWEEAKFEVNKAEKEVTIRF